MKNVGVVLLGSFTTCQSCSLPITLPVQGDLLGEAIQQKLADQAIQQTQQVETMKVNLEKTRGNLVHGFPRQKPKKIHLFRPLVRSNSRATRRSNDMIHLESSSSTRATCHFCGHQLSFSECVNTRSFSDVNSTLHFALLTVARNMQSGSPLGTGPAHRLPNSTP